MLTENCEESDSMHTRKDQISVRSIIKIFRSSICYCLEIRFLGNLSKKLDILLRAQLLENSPGLVHYFFLVTVFFEQFDGHVTVRYSFFQDVGVS